MLLHQGGLKTEVDHMADELLFINERAATLKDDASKFPWLILKGISKFWFNILPYIYLKKVSVFIR